MRQFLERLLCDPASVHIGLPGGPYLGAKGNSLIIALILIFLWAVG